MSCNCEDKASCNGDCGGCTGCKKRGQPAKDKARLTAFRKCEPFCDNGGCLPTGPVKNRLIALVEGLAMRGVGGLAICETADGSPGVAIAGGPCVPLSCEDPCSVFGSHFNCERRASNFSPENVEQVEAAYGYTTHIITPTTEDPEGIQFQVLPLTMGYAGVRLPALGVSHMFCLEEVSVTGQATPTGPVVDVPVLAVAIAGERIACSEEQLGSYVNVSDNVTNADPDAIDITDARCACEDLCATTPARGGEFYFVKVDLPAGINLGDLTIKLKVRRCDWLLCADKCVGPQGNRLVINDLVGLGGDDIGPTPLLPVPGDIAYLA